MEKTGHDSKFLNNEQLKKLPFEVEKTYFRGLQENIMNAAEAEDSDLKYNLHLKKSPFTVPKGYFDQLTDQIIDKTTQQKVVPIYKQSWTRWVAVAASLALLFVVYLNNRGLGSNSEQILSEVSHDSIIEYLESENALVYDMLADLDDIDLILDNIYADETGDLADLIDGNPELEYDLEYFEY